MNNMESIDVSQENGKNPEKINESKKMEKSAEKLERLNIYIENTQNPDLKKSLIEKADQLNEDLAVLEIASGLDEEEIMDKYLKMSATPEVASQIVKESISADPKKFEGARNVGELVDKFKGILRQPELTTVVAALAILITTNGEAGVYEDIMNEIDKSNKSGSSRRVDQESFRPDKEILGGIAVVNGKPVFDDNPRGQELNESVKGGEMSKTTKERMKEGDLRKIKMLFGMELFSNRPANMVMMSKDQPPGNLPMTFNKLKSSEDYSDKKFIELLEENAGNFMAGELEEIHKYLSGKFGNQK